MPITRDRLRELLAAPAIEARPDPTSPAFVDTIAPLARRFGADAGRLAEAIDHGHGRMDHGD